MTLITFKDGKMAGDRRTFTGDLYKDDVTKVHRKTINGRECIVGGAGTHARIMEIIEFLEGKIENYPDRGFEAAVIVYNGMELLRYCGSHIPDKLPINLPWAEGNDSAIGIALGAMHSGKSAMDANLLAQGLTIYCGGGVNVIQLPTEIQRSKIKEN